MSWAASTSSRARLARRSAGRAADIPAAGREIIGLLRQRSRPYLFSNTIAPPDCSRIDQSAGSAHRELRTPRPAVREYAASSASRWASSVSHPARRASHCAGNVGRRRAGVAHGGSLLCRRRIRSRLLVSRGSARKSEDPGPGFRGPHAEKNWRSPCSSLPPQKANSACKPVLTRTS